MSRSGRRIRSLTTSPLVIRSPLCAACAKRTSTAGAKWAPKTSAVVVPAAASPSRKSPATPLGVVGVGQQRLLGKRASLEPVEQWHPQGADHPDLGEVHVGVDEPGQHQPVGQVDDLLVRMGTTELGEAATLEDHPVAHEHGAVDLGAQGPAGEGIVGGVQERAPEERHRSRPGAGSRSGDGVDVRRWAARSNSCSKDAATLTAIVAGSLPARSVIPMGVVIRAIVCSS